MANGIFAIMASLGRGKLGRGKLRAWQTRAWQTRGMANLRNLSLKTSAQTSGVTNLVMKHVGKLEGAAN